MYYKVLKNGKIIDVLDKITYVKYNEKHKRFIFAEKKYAQAILSSDRKHVWHENTLLRIPAPGYDTVELVEIDEYEYKQLKVLNLRTPQDIIDEYTMFLVESGVL